jgi:hypothetical protein
MTAHVASKALDWVGLRSRNVAEYETEMDIRRAVKTFGLPRPRAQKLGSHVHVSTTIILTQPSGGARLLSIS